MNTSKQQLLELLNLALEANKAAMMRSGLGNSIAKENMKETQATLLNAIKLTEVCIDEQ
jgi:hypothetical protein